jgi:hypothetical protein
MFHTAVYAQQCLKVAIHIPTHTTPAKLRTNNAASLKKKGRLIGILRISKGPIIKARKPL